MVARRSRVLFREYPRAFRRLTMHQKISYFMIGSYYLVGLTTLIYISIPLIYLWIGGQPAAILLSEYIQHALPVGILRHRHLSLRAAMAVRPGARARLALARNAAEDRLLERLSAADSSSRFSAWRCRTFRRRRSGSVSNSGGWLAVPLTILSASLATLIGLDRLAGSICLPESEVRITTEVTVWNGHDS